MSTEFVILASVLFIMVCCASKRSPEKDERIRRGLD